MADAKAIVNKLIEAEPDPDSPAQYLDWLGQKVDTGPLDKIRFGAYIYTTDEDTIRTNAEEHGVDVENQDFWEAIERDMAIIEANALRLLREAGLHVSDEGHNENARVASVWIDTDEEDRRLALLKAVISWAEGDWPSTTSGTMDYAFGAHTTSDLYNNTSEVARFIDVTIEFTGTDALVEWSRLNLNEAITGDPDDPEVFLKSYMPRMKGKLWINFDAIKPNFPDAPSNWQRENVNALDLFRYNRLGEMREIYRQMKADHRQRGATVPVSTTTYRYKLHNPQGHSVVRHWLDKIGCPPTIIQWACETNPPIWLFVSAKEFSDYMRMVFPQAKFDESVDDPEPLLNRMKAEAPAFLDEWKKQAKGCLIWHYGASEVADELPLIDNAASVEEIEQIVKDRTSGLMDFEDTMLHGFDFREVTESLDPDDPDAFIRRFKPHWQLLSHLRNHHFYFIDDSGRVAVADYSMQNQKDPATGDDGLLILDKSKPITRYRGYLGKKMWNIFVTQYHGGVGSKPTPSGIGASEEEFADLWPKLEPLGFKQAVREAEEDPDPKAYLDAVTGWIDTFVKAGMTADTSEGHEGQWWIKWRLGGAHVWIIVKVRRPIFMQILVNDALYGRNYLQRTFEFRQDYKNVDQKQLVQWFQLLYRVINDAVKHERNDADIVSKLMSRIEAYHTEFKQKQDRGRLGEALDDPEMQRLLDKVTPEQCLHCGNDLTQRHTVVRRYYDRNLRSHELSGHYEGSEGYWTNDEQPSANLIAILPNVATFDDICQRCGTNTAQPVRHEESVDDFDPKGEAMRLMANAPMRYAELRRWTPYIHVPRGSWANPENYYYTVFIVPVFTWTGRLSKANSYRGWLRMKQFTNDNPPTWEQRVAAVRALLPGNLPGFYPSRLKRRGFQIGEPYEPYEGKFYSDIQEGRDPDLPPEDDPTDALERFAAHHEQVEKDALESAIQMAIEEFETRVRLQGINDAKRADQLAAEVGNQYAEMGGYHNGTDEYDIVVSAVNNACGEMFPGQWEDYVQEARPDSKQADQFLEILESDGFISRKEKETYKLGRSDESDAALVSCYRQVNRNIIDDNVCNAWCQRAAQAVRKAIADYHAALSDATKGVTEAQPVDPDDPEAALRHVPVPVRAWAIGFHGQHQTQVDFNAGPYFDNLAAEENGLETMINLAKEGFAMSREADEVAYWFRDTVLKEFFENNIEMGYETHMSQNDVKRWVEHNKPDWYPYLWPKDTAVDKGYDVTEAVDPDDPEAYVRHMETDWRKILRKYGWKPDPHGEHLHFTLEFPDRVWKRPVRVWATHGWAEPPEFHYEHPDPDDPDIDAEDAAYDEWLKRPGNDEFERIRNRDIAFPDYVVFQFDIESYRRIEVPVGKLENFCARFVREAKNIVGTETVASVHQGRGLVEMLWQKAKEIARGLQIPLRESQDLPVPVPPEDEVDPKAYAMDLPQRMASYVKVNSNEEAEQRAVEDYEQAKGKVFKVPYLMAWRESDTIEVHGDFVVRVLATDIEDDILRWHDQYLDPVWEVEVLDGPPEDMELLKDTRSHYIDATSYTVTGKVPPLSEAELPVPPEDEPTDVIKQHERGLLLPELERLGFTYRREKGQEWVYGDEIPRWWYKVYNEQTRHALYVYFWGGQTPEVQANVYDSEKREWFKHGEDSSPRSPAQSQAHLSAVVRDLDAAMQRMDPLNLPVTEQYASIKRVLDHHRKWWDDTLDYLINTQGGTLPGRMGPGQPA
jgi:hypothetical protein